MSVSALFTHLMDETAFWVSWERLFPILSLVLPLQ